MAEATAPCPICHKLVSLHAINNHIDICLLPGGRELHTELSESDTEIQTSTSRVTQSDLVTKSTEPLRKRKSQSPSPRSSKQSFLSFGQTELHQTNTSTPPASKSRRLHLSLSTQSASTIKSSADDHKETAAVAGHMTVGKTSSGTGGELSVPLAEAMRPSCIEDYVGQENAIGKNAILRTILESGNVPSLIFWGPPGCGKVHSMIFVSAKYVVPWSLYT